MLTVIILCLLSLFLNPINLFDALYQSTQSLHYFCLIQSPVHSNYEDIWKALVCGENLYKNPYWSQSLKASGLIHIFVVSGSHFIVMDWFFSCLQWIPRKVVFIFFWAFNAMTGFSAPGTRACLSICLRDFIDTQPHQKTLIIGLICLGLQPSWVTSYSFWLSWLASFLLQIAPQDRFRIFQNLLFYTTWSLIGTSLSLWSLLLNITIAPIIGWVLFPLAVFSFLSPVAKAFQYLMDALDFILISLDLTNKKVPFSLDLGGLAFIVLSTHFCLQCFKLEGQGKIKN